MIQADHALQGAAIGRQPVDAVMVQFLRARAALAGLEQPERRVGEPDRAVVRNDQIVRRIEPFALEPPDQQMRPAIDIATGDRAAPVFAVHQSLLRIHRIAIGEGGGIQQRVHRAVLAPAKHAAADHIAPHQRALCLPPRRALAPGGLVVEGLQARIAQPRCQRGVMRGGWRALGRLGGAGRAKAAVAVHQRGAGWPNGCAVAAPGDCANCTIICRQGVSPNWPERWPRRSVVP